MTDDDGETVPIFSQFQDITDRKKREERLEKSKARLEALYENSPNMINIHDDGGNIIDPNPLLCENTGYDESELTGMKVWELDHEIDPEEARALWEGMDAGERRELEGVFERRDGSTFPVEVHIRRLSLDGKDRFMVISRDISERKERERELERQNERLEEFASVTSHDLRNALNVAVGNLELAREECESDRLEVIADAHDRMETLIDELLDLARGNQPSREMEVVDLAEIAEVCWREIGPSRATLVTETDRQIRAYRGRFRRLLENLLGNAVDHSEGPVTVTLGDSDGGFFVADDGAGIPVSERERVFEGGYSRSEDGVGFGLRIVEQVATIHDWQVHLSASEDGGTRFDVTGVDIVTK